MIISETQQPPVGGMGGSIHSWERGLDPWHKDAFKGVPIPATQIEEFASQGERSSGWYGCDAYGNQITFVPDGTEL